MSLPESGELVFVYGTLRRGGSNAFRMNGAEFVGAGKAGGALYVISWYPGMVLDPEAGQVHGEVFRVQPEHLAALDEFEGLAAGEMEGSEYRRVKTEIVLLAKPFGSVEAWVWEWKGHYDSSRKIPSGNWLDVEHPPQNPHYTLLSFFTLPFLVVTSALVSMVGENVMADSDGNHMVQAVASSLLFWATPFAGIMASKMADKRRERWRLLRKVSEGFCVIWLVLSIVYYVGG